MADKHWITIAITGSKVYIDGSIVFSGGSGQTSIGGSVPLATGVHHLTVI